MAGHRKNDFCRKMQVTMCCKICSHECKRVEEIEPAMMGVIPFQRNSQYWHTHRKCPLVSLWECPNGHKMKTQAYQPCWCGWSADKDK